MITNHRRAHTDPTRRRPARRAIRTGTVLAAAALLAAGCGGSAPTNGDGGARSTTAGPRQSPPARAGAAGDPRFAHGVPSGAVSNRVALPAPGTSGARGVASISLVVRVHAVAVALSRPAAGIPHRDLAREAADLGRRLRRLDGAIRAEPSGARSHQLSAALMRYTSLTEDLARSRRPRAHLLAARLTRSDAQWKRALRAMDHAADSDVAALVPPLILPERLPAGAPIRGES
jgi:hypothetical protein